MNHELKTTLYERKQFLENTITEKEHALQSAPKGELRFNHHGKRIQYYCRTDPKDTNGKYIKAKDQDFASALAQKDYDRKVLKLAQSELRSITPLLKQYATGPVESVYENLPEPRQKLIQPIILTDEKYIEKWQEMTYEKNGYFPGNNLILTFETSSHPIPTKLIEKLISHYLV